MLLRNWGCNWSAGYAKQLSKVPISHTKNNTSITNKKKKKKKRSAKPTIHLITHYSMSMLLCNRQAQVCLATLQGPS